MLAPVARDALVDEGAELRPRTAPAAGTSLRMSISACSLSARSCRPAAAVGVDRFAAGLDLARQDGQELVVGEGRCCFFSTL